jgi:hypothetical protein
LQMHAFSMTWLIECDLYYFEQKTYGSTASFPESAASYCTTAS